MGSRDDLQRRRACHRIFFQHLVFATLLAFATGQASANHPGGDHNNGKPSSKASLLAFTTCALSSDNRKLVVTTTLTNKSTGGIVSEVRGGTISGTYKMSTARGKDFKTFDETDVCDVVAGGCEAVVDPELVIIAEFSLCNGVIDVARELNGQLIVEYGISGGGEESRTLESHCKDDPDSPDGKGGIKVADVFDDIATACGP